MATQRPKKMERTTIGSATGSEVHDLRGGKPRNEEGWSTHKASSDRDMRPNLVPPHDEDLPPMTALTDDSKLW